MSLLFFTNTFSEQSDLEALNDRDGGGSIFSRSQNLEPPPTPCEELANRSSMDGGGEGGNEPRAQLSTSNKVQPVLGSTSHKGVNNRTIDINAQPLPKSYEVESAKTVKSNYRKIQNKKKIPVYRLFTRKGAEYVLMTPLKRGSLKQSPSGHSSLASSNSDDIQSNEDAGDSLQPPPKRAKSSHHKGAVWIDDMISILRENANQYESRHFDSDIPINQSDQLVVASPEQITRKAVKELRDKLFLDAQGVIRTKRAFHFNANVKGSVLLWPEEVKSIMKQKFLEFGKLDDVEGFFKTFWSWYQPRYREEEVKFRTRLTQFVFQYDEVAKLQDEENRIIEQLLGNRFRQLDKLGKIQNSINGELRGNLHSIIQLKESLKEKLSMNNPRSEFI